MVKLKILKRNTVIELHVFLDGESNSKPGLSVRVGGVFGLRTRVDEIWPSMDFGIWISMLSVWLDRWGELFFCLVGWMRLHGMRILD